ncbi:MAG: aldehyde dehydrogenase [Planctomycetaceae bacterium]|nr:aldehyde dehydrogenase [Planctomycetaceae bacterium]
MTSYTIEKQRISRAPSNSGGLSSGELNSQLARVRAAQLEWSQTDLRVRLDWVRRLRGLLVNHADQLAAKVSYPYRNQTAETFAAEIIPLADACRFLEQNASRILSPRRLSRRSRPAWLRGVSVQVRRDPFGLVLIVGAANYPLFLPGVQTIQALVAGNGVAIKPALQSSAPAQALRELMIKAGLDADLVQVLPDANRSVKDAVAVGVDKVLLTGSANTGRKVQAMLAETLTPSAMELSGCDAVFVLPTAALDQVAKAILFGLRFNNSATCIAPRRVFIASERLAELEQLLLNQVTESHGDVPNDQRAVALVKNALERNARAVMGGIAIKQGAEDHLLPTVLSDVDATMPIFSADVFAPVTCLVPVANMEQANVINEACPYALGATVFGERRAAREFASQVNAGCVVVNDMIAPTADPRVPFGGRRQSGFGVTRGAIGLEELTQVKSVSCQNSRWLPHFDEPTPFDADLLAGFLEMAHGSSLREKALGLRSVIKAIVDQQSWKRKK